MSEEHRTARQDFRLLTRTRGGYDGSLYDIQLQVASSGSLLWAQTFTDQAQADDFQAQVDLDMDELDYDDFRRKYSVPSSAA